MAIKTITYRATLGSQTDTATVTINILPAPVPPPVCVNDPVSNIPAGSGFVDIDVLENDSNVAGATISVSGFSGPSGSSAIKSPSGNFVRFTPGASATGAWQVTYTATTIGGSDNAVVSGNVVAAAATGLLGSWPLSETSGNTFNDATGSNDAVLTVPSWTVATHKHNRRGIVAGSDHALEISNGGPSITMITAYKLTAMSLVFYTEPMGELRGTQYWVESSEKYGREILACCDTDVDAANPASGGGPDGSWAIYRKRIPGEIASSTGSPNRTWRLGGYVRSGGTKQYFGGSQGGISTTSLPPPSPWPPATGQAHRIALTMGPGGAELWLDDTRVSHLASVTVGWSGLNAPIRFGCSQSTGHANDRSPFWGRIDQIEVWSGKIDPTDRPDAAQSVVWRDPTNSDNRIDIASQSGLQAAMDNAGEAGKWLWQSPTNTTVYTLPANTQLFYDCRCPGIVGLRFRFHANHTVDGGGGMLNMDPDLGSKMDGHNNRFAGSGGYQIIGCFVDGNIRGRSWSAYKDMPGVDRTDFGDDPSWDGTGVKPSWQNQPGIRVRSERSNGSLTVKIDACGFVDGVGDAVSIYDNAKVTIESSRMYGFYRGAVVINNWDRPEVRVTRFESFMESRVEDTPYWNGCGFTDSEPFTSGGGGGEYTRLDCYDCWAEADWDDHPEQGDPAGSDAWDHYTNCHHVTAGLLFAPDRQSKPIADWSAKYCTVSFYRQGGSLRNTDGAVRDTSNFPRERWSGTPAANGKGLNFENTVFLLNGRETTYHEFGMYRPETSSQASSEVTGIVVQPNYYGTRVLTFLNCQVRTLRLSSNQPRANKRFLNITDFSGHEIYIDGLTIDSSLATACITMSGGTVRHRNVVHGAGGGISSIITGASTYTAI